MDDERTNLKLQDAIDIAIDIKSLHENMYHH